MMVSISSDIWGEDGKSLLALMVHLIDSNFKLHDILIFAKPFSKVAHTAINIEQAIKEALASYKIGEYDKSAKPKVDTVRLIIKYALYLYVR
jgi:hypothetical protein